MNRSHRESFPTIDKLAFKTSQKGAAKPQRPLDFISFDDSEIFCDVAQPRLADYVQKSPATISNKTLNILSTGRDWSRRSTDNKLRNTETKMKNILMGSKLNNTITDQYKNVDYIAKLAAVETYFLKTALPPNELHLSADLQESFKVEHEALGKSLAVVELLAETHLGGFPLTRAALEKLIERNIFFEYSQLAYFKAELETLCSPECVNLLQGDVTTWRTVAGIICAEASRGLAAEANKRQQAEQRTLDANIASQALERRFNSEDTKVRLKLLEEKVAMELYQKELLDKRVASLENELKRANLQIKDLKQDKEDLEKLQSNVELKYAQYLEQITGLGVQRAEAVKEMEIFKKKFVDLHFSFNETVEASIKMMTKLKTTKKEIDYLKAENLKLRHENEDMVSKHMIGVDLLTPRPKFKELAAEYKNKIELQPMLDLHSTEAKVMFLLEKLAESVKVKVAKKRSVLLIDPSTVLLQSDSRAAMPELAGIPLTSSKLIKTNDASEKKTEGDDKDSKPLFTKLKVLKRKFDDERKEMS